MEETMDLDALLTRAEAQAADSWEDAQVVLAGDVLDVAVARVSGTVWADLKAQYPPRLFEDQRRGYDVQGISRVFPRVKVSGVEIAADAWARLYDALDAENQGTVDALVWGVNVFHPQRARQAALDAAEEAAKVSPE